VHAEHGRHRATLNLPDFQDGANVMRRIGTFRPSYRQYRSGSSDLCATLATVVVRVSALIALAIGLSAPAWGGVTEIPILIPQKHPVIQEIIDGINKGFEEQGYASRGYTTNVLDGQGVPANLSTMVDACLEKRPPIVISITTGLSKIAADKVAGRVPLVFSGVTDPIGAGIVPDLVKHGGVTGTSDLWPIEDQLRLI